MAANPACVAYEAYRTARNADTPLGMYYLPWFDLSPSEQKAWWDAVRAVLQWRNPEGAETSTSSDFESEGRTPRDSEFLELRAKITKLLDEYAAGIPPTREPIPDLSDLTGD